MSPGQGSSGCMCVCARTSDRPAGTTETDPRPNRPSQIKRCRGPPHPKGDGHPMVGMGGAPRPAKRRPRGRPPPCPMQNHHHRLASVLCLRQGPKPPMASQPPPPTRRPATLLPPPPLVQPRASPLQTADRRPDAPAAAAKSKVLPRHRHQKQSTVRCCVVGCVAAWVRSRRRRAAGGTASHHPSQPIRSLLGVRGVRVTRPWWHHPHRAHGKGMAPQTHAASREKKALPRLAFAFLVSEAPAERGKNDRAKGQSPIPACLPIYRSIDSIHARVD